MAEDNQIGERDKRPWIDVLKLNIGRVERLKRNILEIVLEKETIFDVVEEQVLADLFKQMGIKRETVEGIQLVPPRTPKKVFVWIKPGIDLNQFCFEDSFRLNSNVKTGFIKPMDRREVEVIIRGLNLNTPDGAVMQYLAHFGKIVKEEVVYLRNKVGPFAGLKNGDRKYLLDFTCGKNLDSFHIIDGVRVTISYPGQKRTCGRCLGYSADCPGSGIARVC